MLFTIEPVFPEEILVRVYLIIILAVKIFERVRVWFTLLGFEFRRISFTVCFIVLSKVLMMFGFVGAIIPDVFSSLNPV